ncbi:MFS transporter [Rhodoblastus sphagnicola]|uniref:MFS transporter n=1 Tax=Rhodoblastus sphagnicola TaxID=333368 RepID=A0A2S6NE97_9HYPH|nr:MFS transporter [Rhodoblastus sphagnicola]MBB4199893.1 MFS family permease [Rhodoblastus sphagnicola]PPQ32948.1 MFS transporter [Rhodoblastus sphagnicola]
MAAVGKIGERRTSAEYSRDYEFKAVGLLALGFGMVGLDRFIISPLFPTMQKELGLTYQDLGLISAVLALTWGAASIFSGQISDRLGHKPVIVVSAIVFSVLVATTGLAGGLLSLVALRAMMGVAEGAFVPASITATVEASKPSRIGMNVGIQQTAAPLFGLGFGPLIAVALLKELPSWHYVFGVVAIPGFIVALLLAKVLRHDPPHSVEDHTAEKSIGFLHALGNRNVIFNILGMCLYLATLIVLSAFMPSYLTDHLKLGVDAMGMVLAGMGLGSFIGMVAIPAISDRLGRKPVMLVSLAVEFAALLTLMQVGASPLALFATIFVATFMNAGVVAITVGPLTHASVPPAIAATATGLVVGVGEIFGGALAPVVAGGLADAMGLPVIIKIGALAIGLAFFAVLFGVREPDIGLEAHEAPSAS